MAAPLLRSHLNKFLPLKTGLHNHCISFPKYLHVSTCLHKLKSPDVCLSPEKNMIMSWHPEPEHPYEHTLPLMRDKTELESNVSVLKVQYLIDEKLKNRPDGPTVNELSELFYTTKMQFYRRKRHEKKTEMIKYKPKDREGF